jgi:hypothetical protein
MPTTGRLRGLVAIAFPKVNNLQQCSNIQAHWLRLFRRNAASICSDSQTPLRFAFDLISILSSPAG